MVLPYLLPAFLEGLLIGAVITFADQPLYRTYRPVRRTSSFSDLEDQQLGGLSMWLPGGMMYLIPLAVVLAVLVRR